MTSGFSSCPIANQTDGPKKEHPAKTEETGSVTSNKRADHAPEAEAFDESPTGASRRLLPNDRAVYIEALGEEAKCPLLNEEIADWARRLGRPGHDGERELKELLILAWWDSRPFVSEESVDDDRKAAKRLQILAERIRENHAELSKLPETIQAALHVRVAFRAGLDHDNGMAWLRIMPQMLEDVAEVWRTTGPKGKRRPQAGPAAPPARLSSMRKRKKLPPVDSDPSAWNFHAQVGRPSLERESFAVDVFYQAVEEFIGKRLPSPRSTNDNEGLQLVRLLVQLMFPLAATEEGGIPTMLGHFHKRWLRLKKQTAAT